MSSCVERQSRVKDLVGVVLRGFIFVCKTMFDPTARAHLIPWSVACDELRLGIVLLAHPTYWQESRTHQRWNVLQGYGLDCRLITIEDVIQERDIDVIILFFTQSVG